MKFPIDGHHIILNNLFMILKMILQLAQWWIIMEFADHFTLEILKATIIDTVLPVPLNDGDKSVNSLHASVLNN